MKSEMILFRHLTNNPYTETSDLTTNGESIPSSSEMTTGHFGARELKNVAAGSGDLVLKFSLGVVYGIGTLVVLAVFGLLLLKYILSRGEYDPLTITYSTQSHIIQCG